MPILGLLGMYFDAAVVFVTKSLTFFQIGCGHTVVTQTHLGSILYNLEPSEVPYSKNQKLVEKCLCVHGILKQL